MIDLDPNKRWPIQNAEARPEECFGETAADILGNKLGVSFDPDFSMAAGFHVQGKGGSDDGMDLKAGMYGACFFGAMPESVDVSDPIQTSEAIETNWSGYTDRQTELAAKFAQSGFVSIPNYDAVAPYLARYRMGCLLQFRWYTSFRSAPANGQLPIPTAGEAFSQHIVACYESGPYGLKLKVWDGPYYHYMSRDVFQKAFVAGYGWVDDAYRFLTLVSGVLYTRNWSLLPELKGAMMRK